MLPTAFNLYTWNACYKISVYKVNTPDDQPATACDDTAPAPTAVPPTAQTALGA